ncbi:serine hydrolase domain-containing protein [Capnocytophaga canimorsus]|nr:serine hydrolase domain-containing protein [Capnocytophaga canimorsus]WGU68141.1 serine hydrolase domain-containing protein [Capnocytophaga canimorsus]
MIPFFGKADYEKQLPFDKNSIFQAASISKQFTATAILILEQQGKLQLEDNVKKTSTRIPLLGGKNNSSA